MSLTDMAVATLPNILTELWPDERIALACKVLDKNPEDYGHLDSGRKSMTGGNLLRNALKKDESLLSRIAEEAASIVSHRDPSTAPAPKKESSGKPVVASEHSRSSEKNYGKREQAEWVFDEKEMKRLETVYEEDEALKAAGKYTNVLMAVITPTTFLDFRGHNLPRYSWTKRAAKGQLKFS